MTYLQRPKEEEIFLKEMLEQFPSFHSDCTIEDEGYLVMGDFAEYFINKILRIDTNPNFLEEIKGISNFLEDGLSSKHDCIVNIVQVGFLEEIIGLAKKEYNNIKKYLGKKALMSLERLETDIHPVEQGIRERIEKE
jgi:hypothetical protein